MGWSRLSEFWKKKKNKTKKKKTLQSEPTTFMGGPKDIGYIPRHPPSWISVFFLGGGGGGRTYEKLKTLETWGPGGALSLWRLRGCKAPKTRYFQYCCHQWIHIFADCLCCHPKTPHFLVNVGSSIALTQRPPFFAFGCHRKLFFFSISSTNL